MVEAGNDEVYAFVMGAAAGHEGVDALSQGLRHLAR